MPRMLTSEDTANIRNMLQVPPSMSPTQFAVSSLACVPILHIVSLSCTGRVIPHRPPFLHTAQPS